MNAWQTLVRAAIIFGWAHVVGRLHGINPDANKSPPGLVPILQEF